MIPIRDTWCAHVEVTNRCPHRCPYCTRYTRHLREDQLFDLTLEQIERALLSLKDKPGLIGIMGGEPIRHPQFVEICQLIQRLIPKQRMHLWTSGGPSWNAVKDVVGQTFGHLAYNEHNSAQRNVCLHQPLTVAVGEVVADPQLRQELIDDCWVQRLWCPSITHKGAFFCEVAAALDTLLDGPGGYPVEPGWWERKPADFQDQVERYCQQCGMCVPLPRATIATSREKFTPRLLALFREKRLERLAEQNVEVVELKLDRNLVTLLRQGWEPWNYRQDLK
jgi:hypothetical protein